MKIKLYANTGVDNVLDYIGGIAGACYGAENTKDKNIKRAKMCAANGHASVFEHISFTFCIEGISRACSHQLVRHRLASYTQQSQRYCKIDTDSDWYAMPDVFTNSEDDEIGYRNFMAFVAHVYQDMIDSSIKPEDARSILPNSCKTNIFVTMNLREFYRFYNLRTGKGAQAEIHELADKMMSTVVEKFPELEGFNINE